MFSGTLDELLEQRQYLAVKKMLGQPLSDQELAEYDRLSAEVDKICYPDDTSTDLADLLARAEALLSRL